MFSKVSMDNKALSGEETISIDKFTLESISILKFIISDIMVDCQRRQNSVAHRQGCWYLQQLNSEFPIN